MIMYNMFIFIFVFVTYTYCMSFLFNSLLDKIIEQYNQGELPVKTVLLTTLGLYLIILLNLVVVSIVLYLFDSLDYFSLWELNLVLTILMFIMFKKG